MSLLADLLSKTKNSDSSGGKDVPPTLARGQNTGNAPSGMRKRLTIMSVIAVAAILVGIFLPSQLKHLALLLPAKRAVVPALQEKVALPQRTLPEQVVADANKTAAVANQDKNAAAGALAQKPYSSAGTNKKAATHHMVKSHRHHSPKGAVIPGNMVTAKPASATKAETEAAPVKMDTDARGTLLYAARSSEQSGDWRGALASYNAALDIDPENYRILSNSAAAYNKLGMYVDGEREARRALERKPNYIPALINAAIACSSQGNNKDALKFFNAATTADPGNRSLAINLGVMQERTGNWDDALETYRRAAASGDAQALLGMARVQEQKGNKSEAINAYKLVMLMKDTNPTLKREVKSRLLRLEE